MLATLDKLSFYLDDLSIINLLLSSRTWLVTGLNLESVSFRLLAGLQRAATFPISLTDPSLSTVKGLTGVTINSLSPGLYFLRHGAPYSTNLCYECFPLPMPVLNSSDSPSSSSKRNLENISLFPFSSLSRDRTGVGLLRLSFIKYFEVPFRLSPTPMNIGGSNHNKRQRNQLSIGLTTKITHMDSGKREDDYFVYKHNGLIAHRKIVVANGPYYRYSAGDVIGCGIVYPPLCRPYGQVFFTRNGEVVHMQELGKRIEAWYPFSVTDCRYEGRMNFGDSEPFVFNLALFENTKLQSSPLPELHTTSYSSLQDQDLLQHPSYLSFLYLNVVVKLKSLYEQKAQEGEKVLDSSLFSHLLGPHSLSDSSGESDAESHPPADEDSLPSQQPPFSMQERVFFANSLLSTQRETSGGSAEQPRIATVNFAQDVGGMHRSRSNSRGEEDSMAVELSSVDSVAVQELGGIEIGGRDSTLLRAPSQLSREYEQSWWVEQRIARQCPPGESGEGEESDRSLATSLFVEIASLDENGSYTGYGRAGDEEDEGTYDWEREGREQQEESEGESYAPYVPWQGSGRASYGGENSYSSIREKHRDEGKRRKRKREDSWSSSSRITLTASSNKRGAIRSPPQGGQAYVTRCSSPLSLLSAEKNDGEDGYDGASEMGGRYEENELEGGSDHDFGGKLPSPPLPPPQPKPSLRRREGLGGGSYAPYGYRTGGIERRHRFFHKKKKENFR